jgi:hypothetical protein
MNLCAHVIIRAKRCPIYPILISLRGATASILACGFLDYSGLNGTFTCRNGISVCTPTVDRTHIANRRRGVSFTPMQCVTYHYSDELLRNVKTIHPVNPAPNNCQLCESTDDPPVSQQPRTMRRTVDIDPHLFESSIAAELELSIDIWLR